jgi:CRISPR-associated endonuclease/helicase Cas3
MEKLYHKYWGKARKGEDGTYEYHLLPYHCLDVAAVGSVLLKSNPEILPSLHIITNHLKVDPDSFLKLLLSLHDLGKFAKTFQALIPDIQLELQGRNRGKPVPVRHDALGAALWRSKYMSNLSDRLISEVGFECISIIESLETFVNITSGHHGIPANPESSTNIDDFFDAVDYQSIEEFWVDLVVLFNIDIFCTDNKSTTTFIHNGNRLVAFLMMDKSN